MKRLIYIFFVISTSANAWDLDSNRDWFNKSNSMISQVIMDVKWKPTEMVAGVSFKHSENSALFYIYNPKSSCREPSLDKSNADIVVLSFNGVDVKLECTGQMLMPITRAANNYIISELRSKKQVNLEGIAIIPAKGFKKAFNLARDNRESQDDRFINAM